MQTHSKLTLVFTGLIFAYGGLVNAADPQQTQEQTQQQTQLKDQDQQLIYGWELMSVKERAEHRKKMLSLKTEQERTAYRQEHHKLMQQRAKEKGVSIPDMPAQGGFGPGAGAGAGAGQGAGGGRKN
jgi:hypothetical protein